MLNVTKESRALQGPWTTLVKGRGLGANTKIFDPAESGYIKKIFRILDESSIKSNPYNQFSKELCAFILDFNDPKILFFQKKELHPRIEVIIELLKSIDDPYFYVSASSILFESFGKLGLDPHLWLNKEIDLIGDALNQLECLSTSNEKECYIALQLYGNLFLGISHIGLVDKLTTGNIDYVAQAFKVAAGLENIWYKGRGIAAFLTVMGLIGLSDYATKPDNNRLQSLVSYMDVSLNDCARVERHPNEYVFSILLLINCIGVLDESTYLEYRRDWIKVAGDLIDTLPPNLKAIFSHYYLSALDNLGLTHRYAKNTQEYLLSIIDSLTGTDDCELDYMAWTYCVDISHKLNLVNAVPEAIADKLIKNISTTYDFENGHKPNNLFYRSGFMRIAYALTAMSQMKMVERLLEKNSNDGKSLVERLIENHVNNWGESDDSYTTLHHALIDLALSQRGKNIGPSLIDRNIAIQKDRLGENTIPIEVTDKDKIAIYAYFPGMNSRRSYSNISRDLYEKGNKQVRSIFETSYEILNRHGHEQKANDFSRFFFEKDLSNEDVVEKWNNIGSSMTVYNLALLEHLKTSSSDFLINSVGGESYGMIAAAIASNSLSLEDGLKVANYTLGSIYKCAHANNIGTWHIISLTGSAIRDDLKEIQSIFKKGIDVFRWQTLTPEKQEVHVYIHNSILDEVKTFVSETFRSSINIREFKRPTIEIVHSPSLSSARIDISNYIVDENISFSTPDIPIVANNGTGIASSKDDVRSLILDMANIPMYSAQSFQSIDELIPANTNAIVEFGYGQKTRHFVSAHGVRQQFFEYFGSEQDLQQTIIGINSIKSPVEFECLPIRSNPTSQLHTALTIA
ncbi:MAG: hypothetical protein P8166_01705 [Candidatus Thiodiazotropha sp.]